MDVPTFNRGCPGRL